MQANIYVKIPERCFVSPNPKKDYPFPFSFTVTYGYVPDQNCLKMDSIHPVLGESENQAVKYPQITIGGFDRLLSEPQKIEAFINDLRKSGDSDWIIKKASTGADIIIRYTGLELSPDFYFYASTERFVSDAKENEVVTLIVTVENFDGIEDNRYAISTKVDYVPWAKSLTFSQSPVALGAQVEVAYEYLGDKTDKELMLNGRKVDTARSPYTACIDRPTLFTLRAFNDCRIDDTKQEFLDVLPPEIRSFTADRYYFSEGEEITLQWELSSASNFVIDNIDKEKDKVEKTYAVVHPAVFGQERTAIYTLRANGYAEGAPASVSKILKLTRTLWKKAGAQTGYFAGDVYGDLKYNSRIFREGEYYYCYAHPCLYRSGDGLKWEIYSSNDKADAGFVCIAADCYDHTVYAMGKKGEDGSLYISTYDFTASRWEHAPAYQNCNADIGGFAFSRTVKAYAQILRNGIMISRCGADGKWCHGGSAIKAPENKEVIGGDYCFYKNTFYAVMLCSDSYVYVYDCSESMEDLLFKKKVDKDDRFVSLIPTDNHLYVVTAGSLIDVKTGETADHFSPLGQEREKRMWLGCGKEKNLMGIYPDGNLWVFDGML